MKDNTEIASDPKKPQKFWSRWKNRMSNVFSRDKEKPKPSKFWPKELKKYRGQKSMRRQSNLTYLFTRWILRQAIHLYHSEITSIGLENIPPDGSVLIVGNHPNSMLDYLNLLRIIRHPLATAAKDTLTDLPVFGPIFLHKYYFVPLARKMDEALKDEKDIRESQERNQHAFDLAKTYLGNGRIFNIYGEGKSTDSRKLQNIKMGFMAIVLEAEREYGFDLNLRMVPFGYFYSRRNHFRNQVAVIFGKPFTIKSLIDIPENPLALGDEELKDLTKQIMFAGKRRIQKDISDLIISIDDKELIPLIDGISSLYATTPEKYMGNFANIKEKYILSKRVAMAISTANKNEQTVHLILDLKKHLSQYQHHLKQSKLQDGVIRKNFTIFHILTNLWQFAIHTLLLPIALTGHLFFLVPMLAGKWGRHWAMNIKKMEEVDGDEKAFFFGFFSFWAVMPIYTGTLIYLFGAQIKTFLPDTLIFSHIIVLTASIVLALGAIVLMVRLWHWSLNSSAKLWHSFLFFKDLFAFWSHKKNARHLRQIRYSLLDKVEKLIARFC